MIGIGIEITTNFAPIERSASEASFKNVGHAAAAIRKTAVESIEPSNEPAPPGKPPHTRIRVTKKGKQLKGQLPKSIVFYADKAKQEAIIGPRFSVIGESGKAHELGGSFRGDDYEPRPFMGPALEANLGRFADDWAGALGE